MAPTLPSLRRRYGTGPLVMAGALPLLFLHKTYQPSLSAGSVTADLSDLALLAVIVAAAAEVRGGARVPGPRMVWIVCAAFVAWIGVSTVYGKLLDSSYPFGTHTVTALKFGAYALLAPAAAVILRREEALRLFLLAALAWSCFLSAIAALQFLGIVAEFNGLRPGQREPSYVGIHDFGAFSGGVLSMAVIAIAFGLPRALDRRAAIASGVTGALGVSLAAALDSVGGLVLSAVAVWLASLRRGVASARRTAGLAALVLVVALLATSLRASSLQAFLRFVGIEQQTAETTTHVESYAHRTLLAYVGLRIWIDHPVLGVGWQGSADPFAFEPELAAAHRRFPNEAAQAFPSRAHPWGVQAALVQALADMGPVGLVLLLGVLLVPLAVAAPVALRGPPADAAAAALACCWLIFTFAVFGGYGLVTGEPFDAFLWLAVGLAARSAGTLAAR